MRRALVLGGGGVAGLAWEIGLLAGLAEAGADVTDADLVVGTSAGSFVGTLITSGADLDRLLTRQLAPVEPDRGPTAHYDTNQMLARLAEVVTGARGARDARARIGAYAMAAQTAPAADRRQDVAGRLGVRQWPERRLLVVAVDAESGEWVAFDRDSGVDIADAVAASCAVPGIYPPVAVNGRHYIDGGVRSMVNADLAAGHDRVLIAAPMPGMGIPTEVRRLEAKGSKVFVIRADQASQQAFGTNILDPAIRPAAARAGRAQGAAVAAEVRDFWKS